MAEEDAKFDANEASHKMDLYSRMIAAVGLDTMQNMSSLRALIIGMRGVGVETAKNLILAGPRNVTIYDPNIVQIADLGSNFYLKPENVGEVSRGKACLKDLMELNPYCDVLLQEEELTTEFIQSFGAVVVCDTLPRDELCRINEACRTRKAKEQPAPAVFILAVTHGVTGHFFSDFGDAHLVTDTDGEPTKTMVVDEWGDDLTVTIAAKRHGLDDGVELKIEDIEGLPVDGDKVSLEVLNGATGIKMKRIYTKYQAKKPDGTFEKRERQVFNAMQLVLDEAKTASGDAIDASKLGGWRTGGILNEIKAKTTMEFRSLAESLVNPAQGWIQDMFGPPHPDQGAWERGAGKLVHLQYAAVLEFQAQNGNFPRLHSEEDCGKFVRLLRDMNAANKEKGEGVFVEEIDERRAKAYARFFVTELTGYAAFLGGIAAQEVVKKFGKYTPVYQWMHCDHIQFVGNEVPSDAIPQQSRYDHQISIFGKSFQKKIGNQKIFLVGCGALGCEYLKGLAMMGVCCGPEGKLWSTDMDRIEISNLSRQFLFRARHVGKPKSVISGEVAKTMNPSLNVEPLEMKVWPGTEDFFTDQFWDNLDLCWNALDNVMARKYTDSKCLLHGKPLLESGTQGTKCNSEVIIPYKTKSYNDGEEQETEGIPMCTLQNFPYLNTHCIEWARSQFTGLYEASAQTFNTFVENRDKFFDQVDTAQGEEKIQMLETARKLADLQVAGDVGFRQCLQLAFDEFVLQHVTRIKNLVHWFPKDHKTDAGVDFWTGHKRFPQIPDFELSNEMVRDYLYTSANLYAVSFGLEPIRNMEKFLEAANAANLTLPEWTEPKGAAVKVDEDEDEEKKGPDTSLEQEERAMELIQVLRNIDGSKLKTIVVADFEKDDDTNFHIDFIAAVCNMRAWNYRIKQTSRHEVKIIAGKIIAALATTTAMITGLMELEFYKLMLGLQFVNQDAFYNANFNLAVPTQFQFFEPEPAVRKTRQEVKDPVTNEMETHVPYPDQWTTWDSLVIDEGSITVQEFVDAFPRLFWGVRCTLLYKAGKVEGGQLLFNGSQIKRNTKMQEQLLARPNLGEAQRKVLQQQVDAAQEYNANIDKGRQQNLIERYVELYGPLISETRNYVLLDGAFEDAEGNVAVLPAIKYVFKPATKQ